MSTPRVWRCQGALLARRTAWLLPFAALGFGDSQGEQHPMQGHAALWVLTVGFFAGAAWQLLYRKDLANRMTFFVVGVAVTALWLLLVPGGFAVANSGTPHALAGILTGLVVAEQGLRVSARSVSRQTTRHQPAGHGATGHF